VILTCQKASLGYLTDSEYRQCQENDTQDEKQEEQNLGDLSGAGSDAGKSQYSRNDRYDEKYKRPFQHCDVSSICSRDAVSADLHVARIIEK